MEALKRICYSILLFSIVFLAVSLLVIFIGYSDYQDYKLAQDTTAMVTKSEYEADHGHSIYITYTFDGNTYTDIYWKSQDASINIGKTVSVKVSPNNPEKPFSENPISLFIIGILFALAGIILSVKLIPASFSKKESFADRSQFPEKSKTGRWFILIPAAVSIGFLFLGLNISPLFHIGTIVSAYFSVVLAEVLL